MKKFLFFILAIIVFLMVLVCGILYGVLWVLQLSCRTLMLLFEKGMDWVDKNITHKLSSKRRDQDDEEAQSKT